MAIKTVFLLLVAALSVQSLKADTLLGRDLNTDLSQDVDPISKRSWFDSSTSADQAVRNGTDVGDKYAQQGQNAFKQGLNTAVNTAQQLRQPAANKTSTSSENQNNSSSTAQKRWLFDFDFFSNRTNAASQVAQQGVAAASGAVQGFTSGTKQAIDTANNITQQGITTAKNTALQMQQGFQQGVQQVQQGIQQGVQQGVVAHNSSVQQAQQGIAIANNTIQQVKQGMLNTMNNASQSNSTSSTNPTNSSSNSANSTSSTNSTNKRSSFYDCDNISENQVSMFESVIQQIASNVAAHYQNCILNIANIRNDTYSAVYASFADDPLGEDVYNCIKAEEPNIWSSEDYAKSQFDAEIDNFFQQLENVSAQANEAGDECQKAAEIGQQLGEIQRAAVAKANIIAQCAALQSEVSRKKINSCIQSKNSSDSTAASDSTDPSDSTAATDSTAASDSTGASA